MKKLTLLFICLCAFGWGHAQLNQPTYPSHPQRDPEKIYLFDVEIEVQPNGEILVTENITLNARHQQINRGIYREIPVSLTEQTRPVSLTMDGKKHPFFTERSSKYLRVNFGNNDYIPVGKHTYSFVYSYTGAINFLKNYDELYWNVTGNQWSFLIDKARVHVVFPSNVDIQKEGISLYTGQQFGKKQNAQQTAPLTFETTQPLFPQEGFTIAIPFEKGAISEPTLDQRMRHAFSFPLLLSLAIFIFLIGYFISTWQKVGRDPDYIAITQYDPPQGFSPGFIYYLQNESADSKLLATVLLDLAMKNYIEISQTKGIFSKTQLKRTAKKPTNLPYEEKEALSVLFSTSDTLVVNNNAASKFSRLLKSIQAAFKKNIKQYIISNSAYLTKAVILTLLLGVIPFALLKNPPMIFINLHFSAFFLVSTMLIHKISAKMLTGLFFTAFYGVFWLVGTLDGSLDALFCQLIFVISMWGLTIYATLIRNVTPQGQMLFEHIAGFKKYMKIAEIHRVAASDPLLAEITFCDYLPFAFALGMSNQWIEKFSKILSKNTLDKCTAVAGGRSFISGGGLSHSISSAMPSSRGGSGSHGGGFSGGGHGGGGGGGR